MKCFWSIIFKQKPKGFSLLEIMVVVALAGVVYLNAGRFIEWTNKTFDDRTLRSDIEVSRSFSMNYLYQDILNASTSLNNMAFIDPVTEKNFFEYDPDKICLDDFRTAENECEVKIEVNLPNPDDSDPNLVSEILFILKKSGRNAFFVKYQPLKAFQDETFRGVNYQGNLLKSVVKLGDGNDIQDSEVWGENQLLLFESQGELSPIRPEDEGKPNKKTTYLGQIPNVDAPNTESVKNALQTGGYVELASQIQFTHPHGGVNEIPEEINSEEDFFRTLPAVGGILTFNWVSSVRLVRYKIERVFQNNRHTGRLSRSVWNGTSFDNEMVIGLDVKKLVFTRRSLHLLPIGFDIKFFRSTESVKDYRWNTP